MHRLVVVLGFLYGLFSAADSEIYAKNRAELLSGIEPHSNQEQISSKIRKTLNASFSPLPREIVRYNEAWLSDKLDMLASVAHDRLECSMHDFENINNSLLSINQFSSVSSASALDIENYTISPDGVFTAFLQVASESSASSSRTYQLYVQGESPKEGLSYGSHPIASFTTPVANALREKYGEQFRHLLQTSWIRWSPDSRSLAYLTFDENLDPDIVVYSLGYVEKRGFLFFRKRVFVADPIYLQITSDITVETELIWGPDGKKLYYLACRGGEYSVIEYDLTRLTRRVLYKTENRLYGMSWQDERLVLFSYNQQHDRSNYCYLEDGSLIRIIRNLPGTYCFAQWDPTATRISIVDRVSRNETYLWIYDSESGQQLAELTDILVTTMHRFYGAPFLTDEFVIYPGGDLTNTTLNGYSISFGTNETIRIPPLFQREPAELMLVRDRLYYRSMADQARYRFQINAVDVTIIKKGEIEPEYYVHLDCIALSGEAPHDTLTCIVPKGSFRLKTNKQHENLLDCSVCSRRFGADDLIGTINESPDANSLELQYNHDFQVILVDGVIHLRLKETAQNRALIKKGNKILLINGSEPQP